MTHDELVLTIDPEGVVGVLHDDGLALHELGRVRSRRASHVEWDDDRQEWVATLVDGTEVGASPMRAEALAAEVACLNRRIAAGDIEEVLT